MYINVNRARCVGLGVCEALAPKNFEIADDGSLRIIDDVVSEKERERLLEAIDSCPTNALSFQE